jgi:hypothetical protein
MKSIEEKIFPEFADESRVWIYGFDQDLSCEHIATVTWALNAFIDTWNTHGTPVQGAFAIRYDRLVILCAQGNNLVSGCSIDSSVRLFKNLKANNGLNALNHNLVFYKSGEKRVESTERENFQERIHSSVVGGNTPVFDNTVETVGEVRSGLWELPLKKSWHANAFDLCSDPAPF